MPDALQFLVLTAAGWVNRHQEDLIEYLREENRVLREQLGRRPLRLTDAQRRLCRGDSLMSADLSHHTPAYRMNVNFAWPDVPLPQGHRNAPLLGRAVALMRT